MFQIFKNMNIYNKKIYIYTYEYYNYEIEIRVEIVKFCLSWWNLVCNFEYLRSTAVTDN